MSAARLAARLVRAQGGQDVASRDGLARPRPGAQCRMVAPAGQPRAACCGCASRLPGERRFTAVLPPHTAARVPEEAKKAVLAAADQLLRGEWEVLGVARTDLALPDWFYDPVTGRRAPADRYAFRINHRSEEQTGNIKQVWEVSRLQHLTLLATAWFLSHDEAYARRVADQLRSWWRENPFLSGVHWTSGIEIGIRLISLAWIRRLLDEWPEVAGLFERDELAVQQIRWHQQYLAAFRSRGSSANNHVIAEAAGQLVASCAFPWFPESDRWRRTSARLLERELVRNTFPSGIGRELASDYQCFVAELGLLAAVEAEAAGCPLSEAAWQRLCAMVDSGAALLDERSAPAPPRRRRRGPRAAARRPDSQPLAVLAGAGGGALRPARLVATHGRGRRQLDHCRACPERLATAAGRPARRPWHFADAGTTMLRTTRDREPGDLVPLRRRPHGYLSIAAHAHADALSVEVRYGGVDVLADPGTYCYHGEPEWRSYFRSTIAHNTVELDGRNQSSEGGPFLWLRHANAREIDVQDIGDAAEWTAEHDGYLSLTAGLAPSLRPAGPGLAHCRYRRRDRRQPRVRLAFHLGPDVHAELDGACALLSWPGAPAPGAARLELPQRLRWSLHRGETDPILGWYSSGLGGALPPSPSSVAGAPRPVSPLPRGWSFSKPA